MNRRERAIDACVAIALVGLKVALIAWVVALGFSHVSDDDYARVVIAQRFAAAPHLDPSGTSWLPAPFWIDGSMMILFGRSLATARGVATVLGAGSVAVVYASMRAVGIARFTAFTATVIAMATPWNAWLAAATVPEAMCGAFIAAAAITMGDARARRWTAPLLLIAALSRYEAWPVCAVLALVAMVHTVRSRGHTRAWSIAVFLIAVAGPAAWMAWNAHAHGSATHFLARVAAYRRGIGEADAPLSTKLLTYPRAFLTDAPDVLLFFAAAFGAFLFFPSVRRRWALPLASAIALLAFLVYGDLKDGAPTHHAARALVALFWIACAFAADGIRALMLRFAHARTKRETSFVAIGTALFVVWVAWLGHALREYPAQSASELRDPQIARGALLKRKDPAAIVVTPCAYEHFALLAAFEAPERAVIEPPTHTPVTSECPRVAKSSLVR